MSYEFFRVAFFGILNDFCYLIQPIPSTSTQILFQFIFFKNPRLLNLDNKFFFVPIVFFIDISVRITDDFSISYCVLRRAVNMTMNPV